MSLFPEAIEQHSLRDADLSGNDPPPRRPAQILDRLIASLLAPLISKAGIFEEPLD